MAGDTVRVRDFLGAVYNGIEGYANVRTLPPVKQAFFPVTDADAIEAFVKPRLDRNCYIGVAVRRTPGDGSLANCSALPALFADIDFKDSTEERARGRLASFSHRPSIIVQSGGGLQPWWLLREPVDLQQEASRAKSVLRRLATAIGADLAAAEPARVLRLPNTFNHKYNPKRLVRVEHFDSSLRFDLCDFDDLSNDSRDLRVRVGPTPDAIPTGTRNTHLTSVAGSMRRRGMAEASIAAALITENEVRCRPPLPEADVLRIAKSIGRYSPEPSSEPTTFVNSLPELLQRASSVDEPRWLVDGLIPGDGTVLVHSQPREYKTLAAQAILISMTTGRPAFGLERLQVGDPEPAWYITEEDSCWRVSNRFGQLLRGYGIERAPELLHVSAGQGLSLDVTEWQERIIATVREHGFRLVVIDPLRSVTEAADQGPRELKPLALFIRRFIRETGAVMLIVHHDTKPPATAQDQRPRPQRASGGGIFSIADSPIHIDRVDEHRRMLVPCAFKFAADPPPVTVQLQEGPGWLRLTGEEATAAKPGDAVLDLRIIEFLNNAPYAYGNRVARGVKARKSLVLERLKALQMHGLVDSVIDSRGVKWFSGRAS